MKWSFFLAYGILSLQTAAQIDVRPLSKQNLNTDTVWIITGPHALGPAYRKFKFDFSVDARQTLIDAQRAKVGGIRIGLEYRRVHRAGIGLYGLRDGILNGLSGGVELSALPQIDSTITWARLTMAYQSIYYERVIYFSRKLEWSLTAHYGKGKISGSYLKPGLEQPEPFRVIRMTIAEFSSLAYYNVNYWCSVGVGVGYRFVPSASREVRNVYESPVGLLRIRFKLGKLVKSIWDKDTKNLY